MRLLLDTHVFLWYISGNPQLPPGLKTVLRDTSNQVYLSVLSVWEASIKHGLGKLQLPASPETWFPTQRELHQITSLPLTEGDLLPLITLPKLHRDPFDRMLISQALANDLTIVTVDAEILRYPVPILADSPKTSSMTEDSDSSDTS